MAKKDKTRMPSGQGGLIRYFESGETGIKLKPEYVVGFGIAISVIVFMLKFL